MPENLVKKQHRSRRAWTWPALLLLAGCSFSPGKSLTLFPENHRLLDSTMAVIQPSPTALSLPRELSKTALADYVVEPGDGLLVQPVELDAPIHFPADQPVLPDGTINLGRYGRVLVAGKTVEEIETVARTAIEAQAKASVPITVRVITRNSKVYYVLGDVNAPGAFPLAGRETVLDGIIAAGGLTDRASRDNIILSRPTPPDSCRLVLPVCYQEIVQLGDTSTNYQLAPGDRIYVASRTFWENCCPNRRRKCSPCNAPQVPCSAASPPCGGLLPVLPEAAAMSCSSAAVKTMNPLPEPAPASPTVEAPTIAPPAKPVLDNENPPPVNDSVWSKRERASRVSSVHRLQDAAPQAGGGTIPATPVGQTEH